MEWPVHSILYQVPVAPTRYMYMYLYDGAEAVTSTSIGRVPTTAVPVPVGPHRKELPARARRSQSKLDVWSCRPCVRLPYFESSCSTRLPVWGNNGLGF